MASATDHIGILMLDTAFPRIVGDAGNPDSYPFPVEIAVVDGATAPHVVRPGAPRADLLPRFIKAAQSLQTGGATGIISTCGFLVNFQQEIARAVNVPVIVSALTLFPTVQAVTGGRPVGILTASSDSLIKGGLDAAQIDPDAVRVAGMEDCPAFADTILTDAGTPLATFDASAICNAAVEKAQRMVAETPEIGAILLECGNLPPYAEAIKRATGRPVFSILDAAHMLWDASRSV